ncbi:MAG: YdcF family protein [Anaerolineae bacterium]|jgi:uncharacterized SAM-binding protein YcdF (DUF218 family)|nr:YdcF family protein [Anaerolineae bacterium]
MKNRCSFIAKAQGHLSLISRSRLLLLALSAIGLCGVIAGPLLVRADAPCQADAIVVIGGDHKPDRVRRAVELYQQGYAPVVIISAGTQVAEGEEILPEAEVMRRQAVAMGMPESALLIEDQSQSTFQNAYYTAELLRARGYDSILLVTSTYHSRRAGHIFGEVFEATVSISVQPSPADPCAICWWFHADQARVVLYEYYNWGRYWLGIRLPKEMPPTDTLPPF